MGFHNPKPYKQFNRATNTWQLVTPGPVEFRDHTVAHSKIIDKNKTLKTSKPK